MGQELEPEPPQKKPVEMVQWYNKPQENHQEWKNGDFTKGMNYPPVN
jgi:hypothetical protein